MHFESFLSQILKKLTRELLMEKIKNSFKFLIGLLFKQTIKKYPVKMKLIFMYHRVTHNMPDFFHDPHMYVKCSTFEMHIQELKRLFKIVSLEELVSSSGNCTRLCSITFDDGWLDNYEIALPILLNNKINATIFLPVSDIGTNNWFWFEHIFHMANTLQHDRKTQSLFLMFFNEAVPRWPAKEINISSILELNERLKDLPAIDISRIIDLAYQKFNISIPCERILVDWDQVNEMGHLGITFGSHGMRHDIIPLLNKKMQIYAVDHSLSILRNKANNYVPFFCYPNGNWNPELIDLLKSSGYKGATTTESGLVNTSFLYQLNRVGVTEKSSHTPNLFWFQVAKAFLNSRRKNLD